MGQITTEKNYDGIQSTEIFYRTTFTGESAAQLGLRVLFNMPVPTTITLWSHDGDGIVDYASGFEGGGPATRESKTINMTKCKLENAFKPENYFGKVFELLTNMPDVNLQDLTGSDLEKAETELFRRYVAENIRRHMWVGKKGRGSGGYKVFDGILTKCVDSANYTKLHRTTIQAPTAENISSILSQTWKAAPAVLKAMRNGGDLAMFVTNDVYEAYEEYLDSKGNSTAYREEQNGRTVLMWHGIPLIETKVDGILSTLEDLPNSFVLLSPRQNLVVSFNTTQDPSLGVRMWYNPDEIENRQRAVFLAGTEILDENLVVFSSVAAGLAAMSVEAPKTTTSTSTSK